MKLNLGCGDDVREGYVNVDFRRTHPSVAQVDLSQFPWPFETGSADEILMLDFLEHFPYVQTKSILLECFRVLKDTGTVVIQVPDGEHLSKALAMDGNYLCNRCGESMQEPVQRVQHRKCPKCGQEAIAIAEAAMMRMYGGQDYLGNFHQTCFTQSSLRWKAESCGLDLVEYEETAHQYANWNFKARFKKGELW